MPTRLPPRIPEPKQDHVFPLLSLIAGMLALLLVFAEAHAMGMFDLGVLDPTLLISM